MTYIQKLAGGGEAEKEIDYIKAAGMTVVNIDYGVRATYMHTDHLGSPLAGTSTAGNLLWSEQYSPFGEQLINPAANDDLMGFTGLGVAAKGAVVAAKGAGNAKDASRFGKACCFVAGTLVETEDGLRPIEEIEVGDFVLSRNPETGETAYKAVTNFIPKHERVIWEVSLSGQGQSSEFFEITDEHPWWVLDESGNGSWKRTDELTDGMVVITVDNQTMSITSTLETKRLDGTYNIPLMTLRLILLVKIEFWCITVQLMLARYQPS